MQPQSPLPSTRIFTDPHLPMHVTYCRTLLSLVMSNYDVFIEFFFALSYTQHVIVSIDLFRCKVQYFLAAYKFLIYIFKAFLCLLKRIVNFIIVGDSAIN